MADEVALVLAGQAAIRVAACAERRGELAFRSRALAPYLKSSPFSARSTWAAMRTSWPRRWRAGMLHLFLLLLLPSHLPLRAR